MDRGFLVDKVAPYVDRPGSIETLEDVAGRFWAVVSFLQSNGLTSRVIASGPEAIDKRFEIWSGDLTPKGLAVMRAGYDKWLGAIDRGKNPEDVTPLQRALQRINREASEG
jgi:hypothetical protein